MGMTFSSRLMGVVARDLIRVLQSEGKLPNVTGGGVQLSTLINSGWVQQFMERHNIVPRRQCGKLMISPAKQVFIEKQVAFHLGCVKRGFESGLLDEDLVENIDETHFLINLDDGKIFGLCGAQEVKYADVTYGG